MAVVTMPNGDRVTFPDDMPRNRIAALIEKKFPGAQRDARAQSGADPYDNGLEVAGKAAQNLLPSIAGSAHTLTTMGAELTKETLEAKPVDNTALRAEFDALSPAERLRAATDPKYAPLKLAAGSDPIVGPATQLLGAGARAAADATGTKEQIIAGAEGFAADSTLRRADRDAQIEANAPDVRSPEMGGSVEGYAYDLAFAGLDMAAPMAMSVLMRNAAPMVAYGSTRAAAEKYKQARDAGLAPDKARLAAGLSAAAEAITEKLPTEMLLKGGKTLVGAILRGTATEGISEGAAEALNVMIDAGIIGEEMTLEEAMGRIGYDAAIGAPLGGAFGAAGHMTRPKTPDEVKPEEAIQPQPEPAVDAVAPEQILALPAPGRILALPAPEQASELTRRHPQLEVDKTASVPGGPLVVSYGRDGKRHTDGVMNADGTITSAGAEADMAAAVRDEQARIALRRTKQDETAELLALARETITPIGAFSVDELGPQLTGKIRAQRVRTGRPVDAPITMTDLVNAKVPQTEIDALLAWKKPRTSSELLSSSDVKAAARDKNLNIDTAFSELALRVTGTKTIDRMSQTQLGALVSTIEALPRQAEATSVPIADLPNFTESQYEAAVSKLREKGRYTFDELKQAAGTKNAKVAAEIRDAMVRRGQLVHRGGSDYRLYDVAGAERQTTPSDLPKGAFSEYTVKKMPVRQVRIKQDGKSIGTFESATAARDKIRALRETEAKDGKPASQLEITHDAEAEAFAVMENRYDEEGRLLGQVPVNSTRDRVAAERMAEELRSPPEALPAEATTPVTTRLGYRSSVVREGLQDQQRSADAAAKAQPRPKKPMAPAGLRGREAAVLQRVRDHVTSRALPLLGVKTKLTDAVRTPDGGYAYGKFMDKIITLTTAHLSPDATLDQITDQLAQVIDHELIHALKEAGVLKPGSDAWTTLAKYVSKAKRPAGADGAGLTYLAYAEKKYAEFDGYDTPDAMIEEAVAEAFRVWASNKRNVVGKPAGIFRQLVQWFRELTTAIPEDVFNAIATGDMVRAALTPPGSSQPRSVAVRQMQQASSAARAATETPAVQARSREFIRARQQARDDRAGRSGPKTVIGTDPSRNYDAGSVGNRDWANEYATRWRKERGLSSTPLATYLPEPMTLMRQLANAQQEAKHSPMRVDVARAYKALASETKLMFESLNLQVSAWELDGQPYATPLDMAGDLALHRVKLRLSEDLFGTGPDNERHPLNQPSGHTTTSGKVLTYNDLLRIVHEVYGRGQSGFRSTAQGDYNAFHEHARLVSPESRHALATEILAQSAWHNYGPHLRRTDGTIPQDGDLDYLPSDQKEWAEQKAFLLPVSLLDSDPGLALAARADGAEAAPKFMVAWHGTPHEVDRFSLDKIGTGEGAQAFGWGLYFASAKQVAQHYRRALSPRTVVMLDGVPIDQKTFDLPASINPYPSEVRATVNALQMHHGDIDAVRAMFEEWSDENNKGRMAEFHQRQLEWLNANASRFSNAGGGRLYQVELPNEDAYLDYNRPLIGQPPAVRQKLIDNFRFLQPPEIFKDVEKRLFREPVVTWRVYDHRTDTRHAFKTEAEAKALVKAAEIEIGKTKGEAIYRRIAQGYYNRFGGLAPRESRIDLPGGANRSSYADRMASERLRELGIPGHRYFDAMSRDPKSGRETRNYVIYDDTAIQLVARFAVGNDKLKQLIETNAGLKGVLKYLTPDEAAKVKKQNAAELVEIFSQMPDPSEMAAVGYAARAKRGWYEKSAEALVRIFGPTDAPRFAALLAATSPQTSVEMNSVNALQMWTGWIRAGRPTDRQAILDVMAANVVGAKGLDSVLPAWINNSLTALQTEDPGAIVLSGPKVNSFMLNLRGVVEEVTNDAWMANYALVDQTLFRKTGPTPGKGVGYIAMNAAVRKAASAATRLTGERWTPEQIQETIWSWAKTLYEKANTTTSAEELLAAGKLTHEEIATTPDFASLFTGGVYRNILEKGGYADALTAIDRSNGSDGGNALRGSVADAAGSGFAQSTFDRHLRRAARRLDQLRAQRAERSELERQQAGGGLDGLRPRAVRSGLPDGQALWSFDDGRNVTETKDRLDFLEKLRTAKATHGPVGAQVAEEPGARMFIFDDGQSGFSLSGDNIVAVFSTAGGPTNVVGRVMDLAIQEGGRRLDGFDTFLPKLYARHGFRAVARLPFSREQAPAGWDYEAMAPFNNGQPDVMFMAYDPDNATATTDVVVQDYDEGEAAQNRVLRKGDPAKFMVGPDAPLFGKPRSPGGALSAPSVKPAPFTDTHDGNKWFAGGNAETQLRQAREGMDGAVLTYMSTEEFLKLTAGADPEQAVYNAAANEGLRFNTIPSLVVDGFAGTVRVVDADGRYAATALDGRVERLPVMIYPRNKKELGFVTGLEAMKEARDARPTDDREGRGAGRDARPQEAGGTLRPLARLPGLPARSPGPNPRVVAAAEAYLNAMGLPHRRQAYHVVADPERGARIAQAYDDMHHDPMAPKTQAAYRAMINEVTAQYQAAMDAGLQVDIIRGEDPYPEGPKQVLADLMENNHLWVYPTESGFGTINDITDNPLLEPTDFYVGQHRMLANDLFRVVHDYFGHGLEGAGFGPSGEENAWQAHMRMFSPTAALAMTSETRGQNSWVNFGPYGEQNRSNQRDTVYADQKVGVLPEWVLAEGVVDDEADVPWTVPAVAGNVVPMKPRAENYPADRQQGAPKYSLMAAFGQRMPTEAPVNARNIVRQRTEGVIGKFINSVGRSKTLSFAGASVFDWRVRLQDRMLPVKEMLEELEDSGGLIDDASHPYMREQLYHGRVMDQITKREKTVYQPLLDALRTAVATDGITVKEFEDFLYAKHAPERNALLRTRGSKLENPSGMSDAEALEIIDKAAKAGHRDVLERLARQAYAITADTTRTRNEAGLISDEAAQSSPFRFYVPLKGFADEDLDPELNGDPEGLRARTGKGFTIGGKEDRSMTGRSRKAGDILGHLMLQNTEAVIRAEKNVVAMSLARLLKENPDNGYGIILESKPTRRVVGPNGMIREAGDPNYKNDPAIVTAKYKGGEIVMRVEPRVARAMRGDGVGAMSTLVKGLAWMNRYLAMVNTSLNPEFLISNLARDLQTSNILAQQYDIKGLSSKITKSVPGAMKGILAVQRKGDAATGKWAQAFREMQEAGGTIEFMGIHDLEAMANKVRKGATAGSGKFTPRQAAEMIGNVFKLVNDVNSAVENALRLGAFVAAREAGSSTDQAAMLAKNLTVNFNKGGEMKTAANAMYLFYNAAIQGSTVLIQGLKSKRVQKMAAAVVALGFVMDMVNRMLLGGGDDEDKNGVGDYDEIPDYVLERNMVIMLPGSRNYIQIPMPYGFNAFFNAGRNMSNMFSGSPVHSPGKSAVSIMMGGLNAFNPLGGSNSIWNFLAPTVLDPLVDNLSNTDFTGRNIVPDRMDQNGVPIPESQKFWNSTNPLYKWTADQINALTGGDQVTKGAADFSPETLEYWTDYTMGGLGKFLIRSGTSTVQTLSGNFQDVEMGDVPFARKVVGTVDNRGNTELYYNHAQEITTLKARLEMHAEAGNGEALQATLEGNRSRLPLIGMFEDIGKDLTDLRKQVREAREAPIPEAKRREIVEALQLRMDQLMSIANARYNELLK